VNLTEIIKKVYNGKRLNLEEGISLFQNLDLLELGKLANFIRQKLHPDNIVTYIIDRNINYTNICISRCKFCAYYRDKESKEAFLLSWEELKNKIEELITLGGRQILLQGGLHPDLSFDYYEDMLRKIKQNFPFIHIHGFSPPEIIYFAKKFKLKLIDVIKKLVNTGLDTIPGGGAEILNDNIRKKISPNKCTAWEWLEVMRTAHKLGIKTTATMVFGHIESIEDRIKHLILLRSLQDETKGFTAFIPWTYQSANTKLGGNTVGGYEYLKTLAISRLVLDNFKNIQASWVTQGPKIAQLALSFGANDMGSIMIEENVVKAAGAKYQLNKDEILKLIESAGFKPIQRNTYYQFLS
jgi:cyclic dehypoxanthinyl futalosine synthase